jgi:YD repeat-containing protein
MSAFVVLSATLVGTTFFGTAQAFTPPVDGYSAVVEKVENFRPRVPTPNHPAAGEVTGDATYRLPIPLPPAIVAPVLALEYSSRSRVDDDMPFGWHLAGLAEIRAANDEHAYPGERYHLSAPQASGLVSADGTGSWDFTSVEEGLVRVDYDSTADAWTVIATRAGTWTLEAADEGVSSGVGTSLWRGVEYTDTVGNCIEVTYAGSQVDTIVYGGTCDASSSHTVRVSFYYEALPDVHYNARGGFLHETDETLSEIKIETRATAMAGWSTHRVYTLDNSDSGGFLLLDSVTLEGHDDDATIDAMPPIEFTYWGYGGYQERANETTYPFPDRGRTVNTDNCGAGGPGYSWQESALIDFSGDGLPDYVETDGVGGWSVYAQEIDSATGAHSWPAVPWTFAGPAYQMNEWTTVGGFTEQHSRLADLDGDGYQDFINDEYWCTSCTHTTDWAVWYGTGDGFEPVTLEDAPLAKIEGILSSWNPDGSGTQETLVDVNGDGYLDMVRLASNDDEIEIWYHSGVRGGGWDASATHVDAPWALEMSATELLKFSGFSQFVANWGGDTDACSNPINVAQEVYTLGGLVDLNADGLQDYILAAAGTIGAVAPGTWRVYLGNGSGWSDAVVWPSPISGYMSSAYTSAAPNYNVVWTDLLDVDGDGLLDLVYTQRWAPQVVTDETVWYQNLGGSFDTNPQAVPTWWPTIGGGNRYLSWSDVNYAGGGWTHSTTASVMDFDADGALDAIDLNTDTWVRFGEYSPPNLLHWVNTGAGLLTGITYQPITSVYPAGHAYGAIPHESGAMFDVAAAVETEDSVTGYWVQSDYEYSYPYYKDGSFRGFEVRRTTDTAPGGRYLKQQEHWTVAVSGVPVYPPQLDERFVFTDDCLQSVPSQVRCAATSDRTRIIESYQYGLFNGVRLPVSMTVIQDGDQTSVEPMPTYHIDYDYDDYANLKYLYHDGGPDGGLEKDVQVDISYWYDASAPEVVRVKEMVLSGWDVLAGVWREQEWKKYYYDGGGSGVTEGLLTEVRQLDWYYQGGEAPGTGGTLATEYVRGTRGEILQVIDQPHMGAATTDLTWTFGDAVLATETTPTRSLEYGVDDHGRRFSTVDLDNGVERWTDFDGLDRAVEEHVIDASSVDYLVIEIDYDETALPFREGTTRFRDDGTVESTDHVYLDGQGLATQTWRENTSGGWNVVDSIHDLWGEEFERSRAYTRTVLGFPGLVGTTRVATWRDGLKQVREMDRSLGGSVLYEAEPWRVQSTDEAGYVTVRQYDAHGRITKVDRGDHDSVHTVGMYQYDVLGRVVRFTDANANQYEYAYDGAGRLREVYGPDIGTVTYDYDGLDRTGRTDDAGGTATWTYDLSHRPLTNDVSDPIHGTAQYGWTWDTAWVGELDEISDPLGNTKFAYDALGRVDAEKRTYTRGVTATYTYVTDLQGRRTFTTTPTGMDLEETYDRGWPAELLQNGVTIATARYTAEGNLDRIASPATGMWWQALFGTTGLPTRIDFSHGTTARWRSFTWKPNGLLASVSRGGGATTYTYDDRMRVTSAAGLDAEDFTWDDAGNLDTLSDWTGATWTYTPGTGNQVASRTDGTTTYTYGWDLAGQLTSVTNGAVTESYEFDGLGRLRVVSKAGIITSVMDRDAQGDLVRRSGGDPSVVGTPLIYSFRDWIKRTVPGNVREELSLGGLALAEIDNGQRRWYFSDLSGQVATLTSDAGTPLGDRRLSLFGQTISLTGNAPRFRAFHGTVQDVSSGLHLFGPRSLTTDGQFLQPDPILLESLPGPILEDPLRLNPYRFARGAPTTFGDSSGEVVDIVADVGFISYDVYALYQAPAVVTNWVALGADVGCAFLPGATGGGLAVRGGVRLGDKMLTSLGRLDEIADIVKAATLTVPDATQPAVGASGGARANKPFTAKGKREIDAKNAEANGGKNVCEECQVEVVPGKQSQKDVTPPANERARDHIIPQSKGGDGSPPNGRVLCRTCNGEKNDKMPSEGVPND